jgi:hypothetical protein
VRNTRVVDLIAALREWMGLTRRIEVWDPWVDREEARQEFTEAM